MGYKPAPQETVLFWKDGSGLQPGGDGLDPMFTAKLAGEHVDAEVYRGKDGVASLHLEAWVDLHHGESKADPRDVAYRVLAELVAELVEELWPRTCGAAPGGILELPKLRRGA